MSAVVRLQLARLRAQRGKLTQAELSRSTGITQKQISALENGKTTKIEFDTLAKLCTFFACTPNDLLSVEYELDPPATPEELTKARQLIARAREQAKNAPPATPAEVWDQFNAAWDAISEQAHKRKKGA